MQSSTFTAHLDGHSVSGHRLAPAGATGGVLLLHGAGHDHEVWRAVQDALAARGVASLAIDLPGHGRSGGEAPASIGAYAAWCARLIDSLDQPPAVVAGHSMGALIALELAASRPACVPRLALLGCCAPMPVADLLLDAARDDLAQAQAMVNRGSFASQKVSPHDVEALRAANLATMQRQPASVLGNDLAACNAYTDGISAAARVRGPVLMVSGDHDRMTPPGAEAGLLAALSQCDAHVLDCGHSFAAEAPEALATLLAGFALADLPGTHA